MKALLPLFALIILCTCMANAQGYYAPMRAPRGAGSTVVKLPAEVQVEFKLDYPKAADVYWEHEYGSTFTASFIDSTVINVTYDSTGILRYTEFERTAKQLPAAALTDIARRYPGWTIETARLIMDSKNIKTYNALLQKENMRNSYEINYDAAGKFICVSPPLPKIVQ